MAKNLILKTKWSFNEWIRKDNLNWQRQYSYWDLELINQPSNHENFFLTDWLQRLWISLNMRWSIFVEKHFYQRKPPHSKSVLDYWIKYTLITCSTQKPWKSGVAWLWRREQWGFTEDLLTRGLRLLHSADYTWRTESSERRCDRKSLLLMLINRVTELNIRLH